MTNFVEFALDFNNPTAVDFLKYGRGLTIPLTQTTTALATGLLLEIKLAGAGKPIYVGSSTFFLDTDSQGSLISVGGTVSATSLAASDFTIIAEVDVVDNATGVPQSVIGFLEFPVGDLTVSKAGLPTAKSIIDTLN